MGNEEWTWHAAATGDEAATPCDLCGKLVPQVRLVSLAGRSDMADPVEVLQVCAACSRAIEQGDVPFEEEIGAGLQTAEPS